MNYISTDLQKRIMFIPLINLGNFFIAGINCLKSSSPTAMGFKVLVCVFCTVFPITFIGGLLSSLLPQLEALFFLATIYAGPVCMSYGLIKLQEKSFPAE